MCSRWTQPLDTATGDPTSPCWTVRTVAAQTRSPAAVEARLVAAAAGDGSSPRARALLLVSGGDPARRLPFW